MTEYVVFPGLTGDNVFAPEIRQALAESPELRAAFAPLSGSENYAALLEVTALIASKMNVSDKGSASGVAGLDANAKLNEVNIPDRLTAEFLMSDYLPKWHPRTFYKVGEQVLNPMGEIVTAKASFTSDAEYNSAQWNKPSVDGGTP